MTRIRNFLVMLRGRLWFIPAIGSVAALILAYLVITFGSDLIAHTGLHLSWLYSGDIQTARNLLSTLLSGLMTMTSLVVTLTFVILSMAANQLGPRLILTFMADRQIQAVLGLFLGTIIYLLVVFRGLDQPTNSAGVPNLAVTLGSALTLLCLLSLVFYVHKIARSIISDTAVNRVSDDLRKSIIDMLGDEDQEETSSHDFDAAPVQSLAVERSGYIQTIDYAELIAIAQRHKVVLAVKVRAGHFILMHGDHVQVFGAEALNEEAVGAVRHAFVIGSERSPAQDIEYSIRQLVEIALRALSPGINDPFTAIAVVDRLGAATELLIARAPKHKLLKDKEGAVRVVADRSGIDGLIDAGFDPIRQAAGQHPAVLIRMADTFFVLGAAPQSETARRAILHQLEKLSQASRMATLTDADRASIDARIAEATAAVLLGQHQPGRGLG